MCLRPWSSVFTSLVVQQRPQIIHRGDRVLGCRSPSVARLASSASWYSTIVQHARLVELALVLQQHPQIINRDEVARMTIAGEADWTWESLENVKN